jgi:flagellar biogenesis protein FliO
VGASGVEIVLRLAVSLGLVIGGLLAVKRFGRRTGRSARGAITVEARAGLAKGASVAVVTVAGQRFLLGVSEHAVSLVAELAADHPLDGTISPADHQHAEHRPLGEDDDHQHGASDHPVDLRSPLTAQDAPFDEWDLDALSGALEHGTTSGPRNGLVNRLQRMTLRSATSPDRALVD